MLLRLMGKLALSDQDKIVFLGDYIDRGPDSRKIVEFLMIQQRVAPDRFICLQGNHEGMMLAACLAYTEQRLYHWAINGGMQTLDSYGGPTIGNVDREHLLWLHARPLFYEQEEFFFSHAPVPKECKRPYDKETLTWSCPIGELEDEFAGIDGKIGVCGHIYGSPPTWKPRLYPHYLFLDAGCGCHHKAPLCAVEVRTREVVYAYPEASLEIT